jgi:hypothetical protein
MTPLAEQLLEYLQGMPLSGSNGRLGDRNDLEFLTGCTDYIPNSFAHQKLATGDTKEIERP